MSAPAAKKVASDAQTKKEPKRPAAPVPTSLRRRVANARSISKMSSSLIAAIDGCIGKAVTTFALARIVVLQADSNLREELPRLDNDSETAPEKPWQSFENLISADPVKAVTLPVTIATDVKIGLTALFIGVADLINATGKLPAAGPLDFLAESPAREANIVRFLNAVTRGAQGLLQVDPISRDLSYPTVFRQKLEAIVTPKSLIDPGAEIVARVFLDFLKVVAWHAGTLAYVSEHLTLNRIAFLGIVAQMEASVPENDREVVRDVLSFIRGSIESWDEATKLAKEAKAAKTPAKKTPAKPTPAKPVPAKPAPAKPAPAKPAPAKPAPAKPTPAKPAPAKPAPATTPAPSTPAAPVAPKPPAERPTPALSPKGSDDDGAGTDEDADYVEDVDYAENGEGTEDAEDAEEPFGETGAGDPQAPALDYDNLLDELNTKDG